MISAPQKPAMVRWLLHDVVILSIASPKAKAKLVENKITHILSIHDAAEPGDGVSKLSSKLHHLYFISL